MKSLANGTRPPAPQPVRTTVQHLFGWGVRDPGDGLRELIIETPQGERLIFPFTTDKAQECGMALMAPSVVRPGAAG